MPDSPALRSSRLGTGETRMNTTHRYRRRKRSTWYKLIWRHTPFIIRNDDRTPSEFSCSVPDLKECQESIFTFESCQKECRYDPCHLRNTATLPVA
jgi:hypothetical protein